MFGTFYDVDGNGAIEWSDFCMDIKKLTKLLNWKEDQTKKAEEALKLIWDGLRKFADMNADDKISQEEWLKMWGECVKDGEKSGKLPDWLDNYVEFMFKANDMDSDGVINQPEYAKFFTEYGLIEQDCKKAYNVVTDNGAKPLDFALYRELWHQYFLSKEPKDPANSLFGVTYKK